MSIRVSQLREWLAEVQDAHGDIDVKFPAMADPDTEESETVAVDGVATILTDEAANYVLICDAYTLEKFQ